MACVVGQQQIKSDEDAHTLIRSFQALRGHFTAREHVLMSFEANLMASLKNFDEAEILYREILARNRYLTGVYKDLGDLFASRFDMDRAWRCWDLARQLAAWQTTPPRRKVAVSGKNIFALPIQAACSESPASTIAP